MKREKMTFVIFKRPERLNTLRLLTNHLKTYNDDPKVLAIILTRSRR
ncbi:MAG: hypothetical protein QW685_10125 [Saccharolobus sp.]